MESPENDRKHWPEKRQSELKEVEVHERTNMNLHAYLMSVLCIVICAGSLLLGAYVPLLLSAFAEHEASSKNTTDMHYLNPNAPEQDTEYSGMYNKSTGTGHDPIDKTAPMEHKTSGQYDWTDMNALHTYMDKLRDSMKELVGNFHQNVQEESVQQVDAGSISTSNFPDKTILNQPMIETELTGNGASEQKNSSNSSGGDKCTSYLGYFLVWYSTVLLIIHDYMSYRRKLLINGEPSIKY